MVIPPVSKTGIPQGICGFDSHPLCMKVSVNSKTVLVGVLKTKQDQKLLLKELWYRIPVAYLPKRKFTHLAFYQPAGFAKHGKRIEYYASIDNRTIAKRIFLLPRETNHPRVDDDYARFEFKKVLKLAKPIKNIIPRRISFGFTSLKTLLAARDILQLYGVVPTENIIQRTLERSGLRLQAEYRISEKGRRYPLAFAVFCQRGRIHIECDNLKAHSGQSQTARDKKKDAFLKSLGWHLIRLKEKDIIEHLDICAYKILNLAKTLGGHDNSGKIKPKSL